MLSEFDLRDLQILLAGNALSLLTTRLNPIGGER
jgi:hypothetical protein